MPKVNPEILRWARETAGLDQDKASKKLSLKEARGESPKQRLISLEVGEVEPSRKMLVRMAKQYRRPLITFYLKKPPAKTDRGQDFRTLPESSTQESLAEVDALIRDVLARQSLVRSMIEDEEDVHTLDFVGSMTSDTEISVLKSSITKTLGFSLEKYRESSSPEKAFDYLRSITERTGIFVLLIGDLGSHHSAIDLDVFRGFALSDKIAPFVVINDHDSRSAWSFTLFHELVHIWLGQTGISSSYSDLKVEILCNRVASELLLPSDELKALSIENIVDFEDLKDRISSFAKERNISSSMVAYKLFLMRGINKEEWQRLSAAYKELWLKLKEEKRKKHKDEDGGPSYYVVKRHRLGDALLSAVHQMILDGSLTTIKASRILGVAPKNLQTLFEPRTSNIKLAK